MTPRGLHLAFGRLLPSFGWEKAQLSEIIALSRAERMGEVPEGRVRVLCSISHDYMLLAMAFTKAESVDHARSLRKRDSAAEQRLWESLRNRRLGGQKFVRQLPVGPYFADFCCRDSKLIVEVDGATHSTDAEVLYDATRTAFLEEQGYRILRMWNEEVFKNLNGVLETILLALEQGG